MRRVHSLRLRRGGTRSWSRGCAAQGRIVKLMGDGVLVEFASAVDAVQCAVALQKAFAGANQGCQRTERIALRIGINLGDVIVEGGDLYGDGVNVAARLEGLAEPGRISVSRSVYEQVKRKLPIRLRRAWPAHGQKHHRTGACLRVRPAIDRTAVPSPWPCRCRPSLRLLSCPSPT